MDQNSNFSNGLQSPPTGVIQADNQAHYNSPDAFCNYTDSFSMTNNSISSPHCVNALNTVSSTSQYCSNTPQYIDGNTDRLPYPPNTTFSSSQSQCNFFKFEIPGFEIIIRSKPNSIMNLNNLYAQYQPQSHSSMNSCYISGTSDSGNLANPGNIMNIQNTDNSQSFVTENLQSQFQQQNSLGFNNFHD
jgi:hypothetical protein